MYFVELPDVGQQRLSFLSCGRRICGKIYRCCAAFFVLAGGTHGYFRSQPKHGKRSERGILSEAQYSNVQTQKSGGGCVYADLDNLMLCYIEKREMMYNLHIRALLR